MVRSSLAVALAPALALAGVLAPSLAAAHVRITSPTPRSSNDLKQRHCGRTGSARANVQTYRPGAPLRLTWEEYVEHPGWLRVAFQPSGDTFPVPPASTGPTGNGRSSNYPTENLTGRTDPATGAVIIADRIVTGTTSLDLTLPSMECDRCTLQLIQMMTDKPPYSVDAASDDIYYACVDLVLSNSAPLPGPMPDPGPDGGGGMGEGCSAAGSPGALAIAAVAVGLAAARRRRRR